VTVSEVTFTPVACIPPGLDVALYVTSAAAAVPVAPWVKVTVACALPAVAVPIVGAEGAMPITNEALVPDGTDSTPFEDIATTVKVTVLPGVSPVTCTGLELPVAVWPELAVAL